MSARVISFPRYATEQLRQRHPVPEPGERRSRWATPYLVTGALAASLIARGNPSPDVLILAWLVLRGSVLLFAAVALPVRWGIIFLLVSMITGGFGGPRTSSSEELISWHSLSDFSDLLAAGAIIGTLVRRLRRSSQEANGNRWRSWRARDGSRVASEADRRAALEIGEAGEELVSRLLASQLPETFTLINNLKVSGLRSDIDHLVAGPTGLFVLETKNLDGTIDRQLDGSWRRLKVGRGGGAYEAKIGDPAQQVGHNVHALRAHLQSRAGQLCYDTHLGIQGLIVFAHPRVQLESFSSPFPAVRLEEVVPAICAHQPRRLLQPAQIQRFIDVLIQEPPTPKTDPPLGSPPSHRSPERGQALVETALVLPLLLTLAFGVVGISRLVHAQMGVSAVAREASRAAALATTPLQATLRGHERGQQVAAGYGLTDSSLRVVVDASDMSRGGWVRATVQYRVALHDLPLLSWLPITLSGDHAERVDIFRSRRVEGEA